MHFLLYINGQRQRHLTQNTLSYRLYTNFTENIYSYLSFEWWQNRNKKHIYIYIHKYNRDKTGIFAVVLEMQMYPKWIFTLNVSLRIDPTNIPPEKQQQQKKEKLQWKWKPNIWRTRREKKIQLSCNDGLV